MRRSAVAVLVLALVLGGVAIAVASEGEEAPEVVDETTEIEVPEVVAPEDGGGDTDVEAEAELEGDGEENHGHCVSHWAHESKAQGLVKRWRGHFVSSVAQDPEAVAPKGEPGDACDFQEELDAALLVQETALAEAAAAKAAKREARAAAKAGKVKGGKGKGHTAA